MKKVMKWLCNIVFGHLLYRTKYIGLEKIPKEENVIICPNHSHIFDPVWIYAKIDSLYIMAKAEIFENKLLGKAFRYFGAFPVKREKHDAGSARQAIKMLKEKKENKLLIFLEGGILTDNEEKRRVKNGAVFIAATTQIPIIPAYISKKPKIFSKVTITFGDPCKIEKEVLEDKEKMDNISRKILDSIYDELRTKK